MKKNHKMTRSKTIKKKPAYRLLIEARFKVKKIVHKRGKKVANTAPHGCATVIGRKSGGGGDRIHRGI